MTDLAQLATGTVWTLGALTVLAVVVAIARHARTRRDARQSHADAQAVLDDATDHSAAVGITLTADDTTDEEIRRRRAAGEIVGRRSDFVRGLPPD